MQLANLCGEADGACLSRSASDAADRRPSSSSTIIPPPMPDGGGNGDFSKSKSSSFCVSFSLVDFVCYLFDFLGIFSEA